MREQGLGKAHLKLIRAGSAARWNPLLQARKGCASASAHNEMAVASTRVTHHETAFDERHESSLQWALHHCRCLPRLRLRAATRCWLLTGVACARSEGQPHRRALQQLRQLKPSVLEKACQQRQRHALPAERALRAPSSSASASTPRVSRACSRNLREE